MSVLARLMIEEDRLPLSREDRAMLIAALRNLITDLEPCGRLDKGNLGTVYIEVPTLDMGGPT